MCIRKIDAADVDSVLKKPQKIQPGNNGATNYWGCGPGGYRIRVTMRGDGCSVETVAWADPRK